MHHQPRLQTCRTASLRGGFTLVELLVVIGIIAILAGVALGPITSAIKKAQQSSGVQSAHAIGLAMYSYANDNQQTYPDKSGGGATAQDVARALLAGGYVTDATIFGLSGDQSSTYVKITSSTNTATSITQANISWDFLVNNGNGVSSTGYPFCPLVWSTLSSTGGGTAPTTFNVTAGTAITAIPGAQNPFGTAGVAVFYINNASAFNTTQISGATLQVNMVSGANNLGGVPASYGVASGT